MNKKELEEKLDDIRKLIDLCVELKTENKFLSSLKREADINRDEAYKEIDKLNDKLEDIKEIINESIPDVAIQKITELLEE